MQNYFRIYLDKYLIITYNIEEGQTHHYHLGGNDVEETTQELSLLTVADNFTQSVMGLDELANVVSSLPTDHLATGYAKVKAYEKNFDTLIKAVRDEFIGTQQENGTYNGDGRLFKEATEEDDKGNKVFKAPDGTTLKASRSDKPTFNEAKAIEVLEEKELLVQGSNHEYKVTSSDNLHELVQFTLDNLSGEAREQFIQLTNNTLKSVYTPCKEKIEALIVTGQLEPSVVEDLFDVKIGYSLLVSKNPYKPKAKKKK